MLKSTARITAYRPMSDTQSATSFPARTLLNTWSVVTISLFLLSACGSEATPTQSSAASSPETSTALVQPATRTSQVLPTPSSMPPETPGAPEAAGGIATHTSEQIAEFVPEATTPAPLANISIPTSFTDAKALIDHLPEQIGSLTLSPERLSPPGYYGLAYLEADGSAQAPVTETFAVASIPDLDPAFMDWTVADKITNDASAAANAASGDGRENAFQAGRNGQLFWLQQETRDGQWRMEWGVGDSDVLFQVSAHSEMVLMDLLDAFRQAANSV